MRSVSLIADLEEVIFQYVTAVADVRLSYNIHDVEVVYREDGEFDIVYVESAETEVIIGLATVFADFSLNVEIFDVNSPIIDET